MPGIDGRGKRFYIRYDNQRNRITDIFQAVHVKKSIDDEMKLGTFDPRKYGSKDVAEQLSFRYFVENNYLPYCEKRVERSELTHGSLTVKQELYRNVLKSGFGGLDVRFIGPTHVYNFLDNSNASLIRKKHGIEELKAILSYAFSRGLIDSLPNLPKVKVKKSRTPEEIIDPDLQVQIIDNVDNPIYRAMFITQALYGIRPCEVRALHHGDIDRKNDQILIQRHFTRGQAVPLAGRKSQRSGEENAIHRLPMYSEFKHEVLSVITPSLDPNQPLFQGERGIYVSDTTLRKHWNRSCQEIGVKVPMYVGTKHVRASFLKSRGHTDEDIALVLGVSLQTVKNYAFLKRGARDERIKQVLEGHSWRPRGDHEMRGEQR